MIRVGTGYDVHRLVVGRELWLGGVQVHSEYGAVGHSDADVLLHAICDALLGAAGLGDIGLHFPDTDPQYQGISSLLLLEKTVTLIRNRGGAVLNIDSTIILEKPKVSSFIPEMRKNIAGITGCPEDRVSVKATTTEGLGLTGRGEGIAAQSVALIDIP